MSVTAVEKETFKLPENITLARSWSFNNDVMDRGNFNKLPQIAVELGFSRISDLPTGRSRWQVYDRQDYDVANFPDGYTRINSTLALYEEKDALTHAILRTSGEPYPPDEFTRDLAAFTKLFIERPRFFGFPSRALTGERNSCITIVAGAIIFGAAGWYFGQYTPDIPQGMQKTAEATYSAMGGIVGMVISAVTHGTLWRSSERYAKRQISDLTQYTGGNKAQGVLLGERAHNITVDVQNGLYQALKQEVADLTPDQFLKEVYEQLSQDLINARRWEVEQAKYPKSYPPTKETGNSLPLLIKASRDLQAITRDEEKVAKARKTFAAKYSA